MEFVLFFCCRNQVLTGVEGTPYASGVFVFDIYCPPDYPNIPCQVTHVTPQANQIKARHSPGGFSPNLHSDSGKVGPLLDKCFHNATHQAPEVARIHFKFIFHMYCCQAVFVTLIRPSPHHLRFACRSWERGVASAGSRINRTYIKFSPPSN